MFGFEGVDCHLRTDGKQPFFPHTPDKSMLKNQFSLTRCGKVNIGLFAFNSETMRRHDCL